MRHFLYIVVLFVLSNSINAQQDSLLTKNVFITFSGGIPVIGNKDLLINDYKLGSTNPFLFSQILV